MNETIAEYDSEAANYDESRFSDDLGRHLDGMHKRILENLVDPTGKLLLDIGIGTGRFATWLAKKDYELIGMDISSRMLKKAKEKKELSNVNIGLILADVHFLPFRKGVFDGCICINVMDHFSDVDSFLKQVRHVIKPKGYFIFNFSNLQSPYLPIALIVNFRKQAFFGMGKIQSRWFTFSDINGMLLRNGFDVTAVKGCFIASPVPFGNAFVKLIRMVNLFAEDSRLRFFAGSPFVKVKTDSSVEYLY